MTRIEVCPALAQRFARDWREVTGRQSIRRTLLALSGGPDSTALLLLFRAMRGIMAANFSAATVDHGLRPESAAEAQSAAQLCATLGVDHAIISGAVPDRSGRTANLSARARALRYEQLQQEARRTKAVWIVTAHHADDQLETMIMRLNRGSGVGGLAGIRPRNGNVARPLLGWRRDELHAIVRATGIEPVQDVSNDDDRFDRARLRKVLASATWLDATNAARSGGALAEADEALDWAAVQAQRERCWFSEGKAVLRPTSVPGELQRRLVEHCLLHVDPQAAPRGGEISRLIRALTDGRSATLGTVLCEAAVLRDYGAPGIGWTFTPAPPRRLR